MSTSWPTKAAPEDCFDSLGAALVHFRNAYVEAKLPFTGVDPDTGDRFEVDIPRWLFRGETGSQPYTKSSMERIISLEHKMFSTLPDDIQKPFAQALEAISARACSQLEAWLGLGAMHAAGFAQHYGLPTKFLDFTASLDAATTFAIGDARGWTEPKRASFAILDMCKAVDQCVVADLGAMVQIARRPSVQQAYGVFHRIHRDFKQPDCRSQVGLRWYEVIIHPQEAVEHAAMPNLLDAHTDQAAGVLQLILDDLSKTDAKWPDPIALHLSQQVAAAPFVTRVTRWRGGQPEIAELVSAEEAGHVFKEAEVRDYSRRLWSRNYPCVTSRY